VTSKGLLPAALSRGPSARGRIVSSPGRIVSALGESTRSRGTMALSPGTGALPRGTEALPPGTEALPPGTEALPPGTEALSRGGGGVAPGRKALSPRTEALSRGRRRCPRGGRRCPGCVRKVARPRRGRFNAGWAGEWRAAIRSLRLAQRNSIALPAPKRPHRGRATLIRRQSQNLECARFIAAWRARLRGHAESVFLRVHSWFGFSLLRQCIASAASGDESRAVTWIPIKAVSVQRGILEEL